MMWLKGMVFTHDKTEIDTLANGKMTNRTVKELKCGQTGPNIKGFTKMEPKMGKVICIGKMEAFTMGNLRIITSMGVATIVGLMEDSIKVSG